MDRKGCGLRRQRAADRRVQEDAGRQQDAERRTHERAVLRRALRLRAAAEGASSSGLSAALGYSLNATKLTRNSTRRRAALHAAKYRLGGPLGQTSLLHSA